MPADSFADPVHFNHSLQESEPSCLDDLTPREKIEYFVKGFQDSAFDLVAFRAAPETAAAVAEREADIWQVKNALELVLSSIRCERDTTTKKRPTIILVK